MKKFLIHESGDTLTLQEFVSENKLSKKDIRVMENMERGQTIGIGLRGSFLVTRLQ
jgi:hypothetical protein